MEGRRGRKKEAGNVGGEDSRRKRNRSEKRDEGKEGNSEKKEAERVWERIEGRERRSN